MSKELPYFRFTVAEWLNDDISLEDYRLQGVFASVCAFYWFQDCSITKAKLKKRFNDAQEEIEELLTLGIIKEGAEDFICIKFLDEQFDILSEKRKKRVEAGRKGGLARASNAKAMPKQSSSYKDKDKENYNNKYKDNEREYIPTLPQVSSYFLEKDSNSDEAEKFYDYYQALGWKTKSGANVEDWKALARNWLRRDFDKVEKGKIFTHKQMLAKCEKSHLTTDDFEFIEKDKFKVK